MNTEVVRYPRYRWLILGMAWLTVVCMIWGWFLIPSLTFPEFDLTHMQFTLIFTGPNLVAILTTILGGALGDRYGIRSIVAISAFLAGAIGLARVFTPSFGGMFALMCLFGVPYGMVFSNLPKLVGVWFPPREVGLASGIYSSSLSIGASFGLLTGPLFESWKPAFTYAGVVMLVVAVLWTLLARNAPKGVEIHMPPLVSGIKKGMTNKNIWLAGMGLFCSFAAIISFSGNLPDALESVHHLSSQTAGAIASLLMWGVVVGSFLIPPLSDRVGLRKPFIYVGAVTSAVCLFFAWYVAPGAATWILIFLGGFMAGPILPILLTLVVEMPDIGHEYAGGASGLMLSLMHVGGSLVPLLVISPLVTAGTSGAYTIGFLVTAAISVLIALLAIFLTETGARARSLFKT